MCSPHASDVEMHLDPGSFRDPDSGVFSAGERLYRYFSPKGAQEFKAFAESGLLDSLVSQGKVVPTRFLSPDESADFSRAVPSASLFVEHERLPFISYGYEWPFDMLKAAALLQLDLMNAALSNDLILKDATSYNVQFMGPKPIFIDVASFEPYQEGTPWNAYAQFCRMFLNPLLLQALTGVGYQSWLRSSLDGISPNDLTKLISFRHKMRKSVFIHVVLQAWLNRKFASASTAKQMETQSRIRKKDLSKIVNGLMRVIDKLHPRERASPWVDYEDTNTYDAEDKALKMEFVERALTAAKPRVVWDLGCNTGRHSLLAAKHADWVVAMDSDPSVVNVLYNRTKDKAQNILPQVIDFLNPTPNQGWAQSERRGLTERGPADFVLCLALLHHIALTGNVPLPKFVSWLSQVTRAGVIEFVPKTDIMVQELLRWRKDIFNQYSQAAFEAALNERFQVNETAALPNGRVLYAFSK